MDLQYLQAARIQWFPRHDDRRSLNYIVVRPQSWAKVVCKFVMIDPSYAPPSKHRRFVTMKKESAETEIVSNT
jgi:hypothetical protein